LATIAGGPSFQLALDAAARDALDGCEGLAKALNFSRSLPPAVHQFSSELGMLPLPEGSLSPERAVPSVFNLDAERFWQEHMLAEVPVVIKSGAAAWPAMEKWADADYLREVAGHRLVPVELGPTYLASGRQRCLMTLSEYMDLLDQQPNCATYLAQHPLLQQVPALELDIIKPEYCSRGGELRSTNAWFGPSGTVTPLHFDPVHNLLAQVVGRKYFRLVSPASSDKVYPFTDGDRKSNASQVDIRQPDLQRFPEYAGVRFFDCVLEAGDMLYLPPRWWHYVQSMDRSFSLSIWWGDY